jgi:hypothetical protein
MGWLLKPTKQRIAPSALVVIAVIAALVTYRQMTKPDAAGRTLGANGVLRPPAATPPSQAKVDTPAKMDAATRRLLAEWRVAVKTGGSSGPGSLVFLSPGQLVPILNRINPAIPATTNLNATLSLEDFVFVLPDSTANRLDLATTDHGTYIHVIAQGDHSPTFVIAPLPNP